ncbi:hypothetical protein [Pelagovum pacificum]|uniref:hypothetical protein n=1 Tax=Pelagovum pacificum TaxID=2588711 RepID=UPI0018CE5C31|nr:hypothetical protein [Pelagovum pacificum]QQA41884.1 hypothetical protein I8N54_13905 [Pelagovum pacificum]
MANNVPRENVRGVLRRKIPEKTPTRIVQTLNAEIFAPDADRRTSDNGALRRTGGL